MIPLSFKILIRYAALLPFVLLFGCGGDPSSSGVGSETIFSSALPTSGSPVFIGREGEDDGTTSRFAGITNCNA